MKKKIIRTICAGNNPLYEIVEEQDSPASVTIRMIEDSSNKINLPKSVLRTLGEALVDIAPDEGS